MRDGIYKDLPLPRAWKGLLRSCAREAERGETARARARRAIMLDASREISGAFLRQVQRRLEAGPQFPGLSLFDDVSSSRDLDGRNSPLENSMLDHVRRLENSRFDPQAIVRDSMAAALGEWSERNLRHMAQHCVKEGPSAHPVIAEARKALRDQNLSEMAATRLAGDRIAPLARRPVDLDEDLTCAR